MSLPNEESPGDNRGPSEENEHPPNEDNSTSDTSPRARAGIPPRW